MRLISFRTVSITSIVPMGLIGTIGSSVLSILPTDELFSSPRLSFVRWNGRWNGFSGDVTGVVLDRVSCTSGD